MDKPGKRGKIPQSDWPLIMSRYEAGETLASIARTYDCSPPAISYVVSRSRAQHSGPTNAAKPPNTIEPHLIKVSSSENDAGEAAKPPAPAPPIRANDDGPAEPLAASPAISNGRSDENLAGRRANGLAEIRDTAQPPFAQPRPNSALWAQRPASPPQQAPAVHAAAPNAVSPHAPAPQANGDHRRTLHLSLGSPSHGNGGTLADDAGSAERANGMNRPQPSQPTSDNGQGHGLAANGITAARPSQHDAPFRPDPVRHDPGPRPQKEGGKENLAFIDQELRSRVDGDIAAFLAAFDAALAQDTVESRSGLREATDRLLRAGARTRIELERLEARLPLPPRDNSARGNPAWRDR